MAQIVINTDELFSLDEAAQLLDIGIATLFRWLKSGKIIPLKVGGRTLITKSEVERLKKAKEHE